MLSVLAFVEHQPPAIAFFSRLHLRAIGDPFSVGRINRAPVVRGIRGDALGCTGAVHRNSEKIAIRAERGVFVRVRRETQFRAIGRETDRFGFAEVERRNVVIGARRQVARRAVVGGGDKEVAALSVRPFRPMAIEKFVVDARFYFALFFFRIARGIARVIFAIGIHAGNEGNRFSIGRPEFVVRTGGKGSEPRRLAAFEKDGVHLLRAVTRGKERELLSVGRPSRALVASAARQLPRRAARRWHDPDIAHRMIGVEVRRRNGIGDPLAVGRNLRIAHALHRNQILERDGPPLGRLRTGHASKYK